jgi:hypothetical protein
MSLLALGMNGLWAGLFSCSLGFLFTVPPRYATGTFLCGVAARLARDLLMGWGLSHSWSTVVAAAVVVLVAVAILPKHEVSPVVLVSGVIPLGASVAMFNTIWGLMRVSDLQGEALSAASVALSANLGKLFVTSLAIALGLGAGILVVRLVRREAVRAGG